MNQTLSAVIIAFSIVVGLAIHAMLQKMPNETYSFTNMMHPDLININVPNPAETKLEMYDNYAVIVRPSGEKTIVPAAFLHAIDVK